VRSQLDQETNISDDIVKSMTLENTRLKTKMGMHRLHIERLKASVVVVSHAYDAMATKVAVLEQMIDEKIWRKLNWRSR
jgi:hypothetical protein